MWLISVVILLLSAVNAQNELFKMEPEEVNYRLPENLKPSLYEIELEPNFEDDTFNGSIRITILVELATKEIVLHAVALEIDAESITLLDRKGNVVNSVLNTSYSEDDRQFYTIEFEEELEKGNTYVLVIDAFNGTLNDKNKGFYLARYVDEDGLEKKLAMTLFEATDARRVFPCFDEPALKAQFEMTIVRTAGYNSISNYPKLSTDEISEGRFQDKFERTVNMSTYLVAFVVSDLTYVEKLNQRVFGRSSFIADKQGDYALETAIRVLDALGEFLDVPYTLPKIDQVAIPDGSYAGAMENWGLVTYRENSLIFDEDVSDSFNKQDTTMIITQRYAQQWFGNLVSPKRWSYLWLNKGFANYFEYYAASIVYEDMDLMNQMLIDSVHRTLYLDSIPYESKSINSDGNLMSYDKAAAVIRMIEGILSTEVFRKGLTIYLNKMKYAAATPEDLYSSWQQAMEEANVNPLPQGENLASVLHTWDSTEGYPLITVTRNYTDGSVTLSQRRYLAEDINNIDETIWYVPISYATSSNPRVDPSPHFWLTTRNMSVELRDLKVDDWLLVNIQERGYYRVNYDAENWNRIIKFLNSDKFDQIDKLNRAQLFDDAIEFAQLGPIDITIPWRLSEYLVRETDYIPLYPFFRMLRHLNKYMENNAAYAQFQNYTLRILNAATESVGFDEREGDRHVTKLNRKKILTWVCRFGRRDCREYALRRLREWAEDEDKRIVPDLQEPLICSALRIGEQSDWDFVYRRYLNESEPVLRLRLLSSLGCSENEGVLKRYAEILTDPRNVDEIPEKISAWTYIMDSGIYGKNFVYNYLKSNWSALSKSRVGSALLFNLSRKFTTQEQYDDMSAFMNTTNLTNLRKSNELRSIRGNIAWSDHNLPSILNWLSTAQNCNN